MKAKFNNGYGHVHNSCMGIIVNYNVATTNLHNNSATCMEHKKPCTDPELLKCCTI